MKRTLCLFLALILAVGICFSAPVTITAFAAEITASGTCGASTNEGGVGSVTWSLDSDGILTISGTGAMADYDGSNMPWYSYQYEITKVVIGNSVTTIGNFAFDDCIELTSVTIPDRVTTIGEYAFSDCEKLTSVTIPDSVTAIFKYAFFYCEKLTSVTIPDSVTTISESVFASCRSLTSVTIGKGVTTIAEDAFRGCISLTTITVDDANKNYSSVEGVLFNKEKNELIYYPAGKDATSYTILDSVTSIGRIAFQGCTYLESVTIPDSVTTIGEGVFIACTALTSVTIGEAVQTIGSYAFQGCTSLASVIIPDSVTTIGNSAFYGCSELASITIPKSVMRLDCIIYRVDITTHRLVGLLMQIHRYLVSEEM